MLNGRVCLQHIREYQRHLRVYQVSCLFDLIKFISFNVYILVFVNKDRSINCSSPQPKMRWALRIVSSKSTKSFCVSTRHTVKTIECKSLIFFSFIFYEFYYVLLRIITNNSHEGVLYIILYISGEESKKRMFI